MLDCAVCVYVCVCWGGVTLLKKWTLSFLKHPRKTLEILWNISSLPDRSSAPSKAEPANIPGWNPLYVWPLTRPKQALRQHQEGLRKISAPALDLWQSAAQVYALLVLWRVKTKGTSWWNCLTWRITKTNKTLVFICLSRLFHLIYYS